MAPPGVVTATGHTLPSFAGLGNPSFLGSPAGRLYRRPSFLGSPSLTGLARQAIDRLANARDDAQRVCDERGILQRGFEFVTDTTFTESICSRAAQLATDFEYLDGLVRDPRTTDEKLGEVIQFVQKHTDISDILELAKDTGWGHVLGTAALDAPGTLVGAAGEGLGRGLGGILGNIPWWAWAAGAGYLAWRMGALKRLGLDNK